MHVAQPDADVAAHDPTLGAELRQDRGGAVDRNSETNAAGLGTDGGIDADDLAAGVDQWAAAVAEVDSGVGLDVVVEAGVEEFPAQEADNPDRDAVFVLDALARLVDWNLVSLRTGAVSRYRVLETIRQFALEMAG